MCVWTTCVMCSCSCAFSYMQNFRLIEQPLYVFVKMWNFMHKLPSNKGTKLAGVHLLISKKIFWTTLMAISEMKGQGWRVILTQWRKASDILTSTLAAFLFSSHPKKGKGSRGSLWPPCVADVDIIFLPWFLSSFFYLFFIPRLISAVADWMSTIFLHMVWPWCEFRMQVWNVLHAAR